MIQRIFDAGFDRVVVLDAAECGIEDATSVLLAVWAYEAEENPDPSGAWIHPYYPASQKAYTAAALIAQELAQEGVRHRDDVLLKPILGRLPDYTLGRNTLSYAPGIGSRFHVQVLSAPQRLQVTHHLLPEIQPLHCGECRRCMDACPTQAIDEQGFHRQRCLRNWMMSGKIVPEDIRARMGNRFLGCDECQRCCPRNPEPTASSNENLSIENLLLDVKRAAMQLRPLIGVNLAIPNRVLGQTCLIAGCSGRKELLEPLEALKKHPSATVAEHAAWAAERLNKR